MAKKVSGYNPWEYAFFDFENETIKKHGWEDENIAEICKDADMIVTQMEKILDPNDWITSSTLEEHYKKAHYEKDFDLVIDIIKKLYPNYRDIIYDFKNLKYGHYCNIFIMKKELFIEYTEWLFSILFELEKKYRH